MPELYSAEIAKLRELAAHPGPVEQSGHCWLSGQWPNAGRFLCPVMLALGLTLEWERYYRLRWSSEPKPSWWSTLAFDSNIEALQATQERAEWLVRFADWLERTYA